MHACRSTLEDPTRPGPDWSGIYVLTAFAGGLYFAADDGVNGRELWRSDGTPSGTNLLLDLLPGPEASWPADMTPVGSTLFFSSITGDGRRVLYKTDGTAAGTVFVRDVQASSLQEFGGNLVFFGREGGVPGLKWLWKSDGTAAGTVPFFTFGEAAGSWPDSMVPLGADVLFTANSFIDARQIWRISKTGGDPELLTSRGPAFSESPSGYGYDEFHNLYVANGHAFYVEGYLWSLEAGTTNPVPLTGLEPNLEILGPAGGRMFFRIYRQSVSELWQSDGTPAGTILLKTFPQNGSYVRPFQPTLAAPGLLFFFVGGDIPHNLWKTDGTPAGTVPVKEFPNYSGDPSWQTPFLGSLYFSRNDYPDGSIWRSDGTEAGTQEVISFAGSELTVVGNTLFFTVGAALWKTDGTAQGTSLVKVFSAGLYVSTPRSLRALGGILLFAAEDGEHGLELWRSDGTESGTMMVRDIREGSGSSYPDSLTVVGGQLFFVAGEQQSGRELWVTDGTAAGTKLVKDINPGAASSVPHDLANVDGELYFSAAEPETGRELWKSDGTAGGTVLVADIDPSLNSSAPSGFSGLETPGPLLFSATTAANGRELWQSDGTAAGTILRADVVPGPLSSNPYHAERFPGFGNRILIEAWHPTKGLEPWVLNEGSSTAVLLGDLNPTGNAWPFYFTPYTGKVFFGAIVDDKTNRAEIWTTDGTPGGTVPFWGVSGSSAGQILKGGNLLFFVTTGPSNLGTSQALWRTDGTVPGTFSLAGLSYAASVMPWANGVLYLTSGTSGKGVLIGKSDGTAAGTAVVATLYPDQGFDLFTFMKPVLSGGSFYFDIPINGGELWKTDGTAAGTVLVKSGFIQGNPSHPTDVNGTLFFAGADSAHGMELWKTDGTADGTVLVKDIFPGPYSSMIDNLLNVGGKVLFQANDGVHGAELWVSDGTEVGTFLLQDLNPGRPSSFPGSRVYTNSDRQTFQFPSLMAVVGANVLFSATDSVVGTELWSMPMSAVCAAPAAPVIASSQNPSCGVVTLDAGPGYAAYLWSTGETTRTITVNPSVPTKYTVYVSNAAGCRSSSSVVQMGNPVPAAPAASNGGEVCAGETVQLSASTIAGAAAYHWTGPNGFTSSQQNPQIPGATAAASGTYSVTVTVGLCTSAPGTTNVVVHPKPSAAITAPAVVCSSQGGHHVSVPSAGPGARYEWAITSGTITRGAGSSGVEFQANSSGLVHLDVTVTSGAGCSAQGSVDIPTASCAAEAEGLVVDESAQAGLSDGNGILEAGETVGISPSWKNVGGTMLPLQGTGSSLSGPPGAIYTVSDNAADYGSVAAGATSNCGTATGNCYAVTVSKPGERPQAHWDAILAETLSDGDPAKAWPIHIGESFTDVPKTHVFYPYVERLLHNGVTTGCGELTFCPEVPVFRLQMAVFLARTQAGGDGSVPPSGSAQGQPYDCKAGGLSLFSDVSASDPFCRHVHYIYSAGVTTGCEPGKYCPAPHVSRAQMAMFVSRAITGGDAAVPKAYGPDPQTGRSYNCDAATPNLHFTDITTSAIYCRHVHYLWARDVISGFPDNSYGPSLDVTRGAMAKFLSNGFNLRLYRP